MPKPRTSVSKRERESRKREREQIKRKKAALKRERRDNSKGALELPAPEGVRVTEADTERPDDQVAASSPPEGREREPGADDGTGSRAG